MTYVGDFPPCTHRFVNSNGVVLCERCGTLATISNGAPFSRAFTPPAHPWAVSNG